jgi:hypothetical protein
MDTFNLQMLLGMVRRRLWQGQYVAAVRLALWGSAGLMLLAVAAHLTARSFPVATALLFALVALWASLLVWAGLRRPSDSACALWADRHLGGASAFTTLLEMGQSTQAITNAQAVRWLEHWATAIVPQGLRLLAERRESVHLFRPLLLVLVCTALVTFVLTLSDSEPTSRQQLVTSLPPSTADRTMPDAETPKSTERAKELANVLRSALSPMPAERRKAGRAPVAGPGTANDSAEPVVGQAGAMPPGARSTNSESRAGVPIDAVSAAGETKASGGGSGRDAGDSRDDRANAGVSRIAPRTIPAQKLAAVALRPLPDRQADMDQLAEYHEERSMQQAATPLADRAPAAATPPAVTDAAQLTPTEATYVQAWMKASGRRR